MTAACPYCTQKIELAIVHQGISQGGNFQRVVIEATHASGDGSTPCPEFATKGVDLIAIASGTPAADAPAPVTEAPAKPAGA